MEQIPQEIYDRISMYLGDTGIHTSQSVPHTELAFDRPVLATISRNWQRGIERRSFQALKLRSNELDEFETIVTGARRRYLRVLRYQIVLPAYPAGSRQIFERHEDRKANDEAFSVAIHRLFQIFRSWEHQSSDSPGYSVQLHIQAMYSRTDYRFRGRSYVPTEEERHFQYSQFGMRYRYSYVRLLNAEELPIVSGVEGFELHWPTLHRRKLAPQTFVEIAAKLPNLREMYGQLADAESRYPALRRICRSGLVHTIDGLSFPPSIKHLSLSLRHQTPLDQAWQPTNLLRPGARHDPFSSAVWRVTSHQSSLNTLYIEGVVDNSLLWPGNLEQTPALNLRSPIIVEPFWQNLKSLCIHFDMTSPSGQWYFRAPHTAMAFVFDSSVPSKAASETTMPPGYNSSEEEDNNASRRYRYVDEVVNSGAVLCKYSGMFLTSHSSSPSLNPLHGLACRSEA